MIWYDEEVHTRNQPEGSTVRIVGTFLEEIPPITIKVEYRSNPDSDFSEHIVLRHAPSGIDYEQPNPDDVLNKYRSKIWKLTQKLEGIEFSEISTIRQL